MITENSATENPKIRLQKLSKFKCMNDLNRLNVVKAFAIVGFHDLFFNKKLT